MRYKEVCTKLTIGRIYPSSTRQIQSTIGNKQEWANYTFGVTLESGLPLGGVLRVTFPTQYDAELGFNTTHTMGCSPSCTRTGRMVIFSFDAEIPPMTSKNVSIFEVLNPFSSGGTGNFWVDTLKGGQKLDESLIFGVIGVANDIGTIKTGTVALETEGVQYAGEQSKYVFTFITSRDIPDNNFVRLYLPKGDFKVAQFPSCAAYPVGGRIVRGRLVCESTGDDFIDVSGFKDKFSPGTSIGIVVTLTNPTYAHITNNFGIAIMRKFTQIMYDRKLDISGVTITPGRMFNVKINQVDKSLTLTRNKVMQFTLHFKPTNILKDGSMIKLQFPASFKVFPSKLLGKDIMFWVEFGLQDKSEADPLQVTFDEVNDVMRIFNYKEKTVADEIIIKFWAYTPDNPGESSPVVIQTFTDTQETYIVDEDSQFAKINVIDVTSPSIYSMTLSEQYSGLNKQVTATFFFTPTLSIPANGYVSITFDPNLIVGEIQTGSCMVYTTVGTTYVAAQSCFKRNREIAIQLNSEQYTKGMIWSVQLVNLIYSPTSSGIFFADVSTFQPDYTTRIQSYTQRIQFKPAVFIFPAMSLYPKEIFQSAVLDYYFTTPFDIPHSRPQNISTEVVSYIAIGFSPSGPTSLKADLGYSTNFPNYIPCLQLEGLTPVDGYLINCTVTSFESPTILISNYQAIPAGTRLRLVISSFANPDGNFITTLSIVKKFNRVISIIAEHSETFQVTSNTLRKLQLT